MQKIPLCYCINACLCYYISQLNETQTQDDIDQLLDQDKYIAIVNSSGWPTTKMLRPTNKAEFLDGLIRQELIIRRGKAIDAFGRGLEMLGLQSLIRRHSEEVKRAFVSHETCLTPDMLLNLIPLKTPQHMLDVQAYRWFLLYIGDRDTTGMFLASANEKGITI